MHMTENTCYRHNEFLFQFYKELDAIDDVVVVVGARASDDRVEQRQMSFIFP
jgi:hypothetical protein